MFDEEVLMIQSKQIMILGPFFRLVLSVWLRFNYQSKSVLANQNVILVGIKKPH